MKAGRRRSAGTAWFATVAFASVCFVFQQTKQPSSATPSLPMTPVQREALEKFWRDQALQREPAESQDAGLHRGNAAATVTHAAASLTRKRSRRGTQGGTTPPLSKDLAWSHATEGLLYVSWTNARSVDFAVNWAASLAATGASNFLVGALDAQAATALAAAGVPAFAMYDAGTDGAGLPLDEFLWGSSAFHAMGRHKVALAAAIIGFGLDVFLCDADTAFLNGE